MVLLAFLRLGCIIYSKEKRNRRMPPPESPKPAYTGSTSAIATSSDNSGGTPSDYAAWIGGRVGGNSSAAAAKKKNMYSSSNREIGKAGVGSGARSASPATSWHQHQYADLFGPRRDFSRRRSSSFQDAKSKAVSQARRGIVASKSAGHGGIASSLQLSPDPSLSKTAPSSAFRPAAVQPSRTEPSISRSNSTTGLPQGLPQCSPIGGGPTDANVPQSARKKSGLEAFQSGSLWDRGVVSPMTSRQRDTPVTSTPKAPGTEHPTPEKKHDGPLRRSSGNASPGRDHFEDALSRALTDKLDGAKFAQGDSNGYASPPARRLGLSRANSSQDGERSSMLMAVKTWTCVCTFENSVGQTACLGCGRVAPLSRPTTPARRRLPPHRMNSRIETPAEADL